MNDITNFAKFLVRVFGWWLLVPLVFMPVIDFFVLIVIFFILMDRSDYVEEQVGHWAYEGKCPSCNKNRNKEDWLASCGERCYD